MTIEMPLTPGEPYTWPAPLPPNMTWTPLVVDSERSGVWMAAYPDFSDFRVFASEVEALRYAVDHGMELVRLVPFGEGRETLGSRQ